jgi:subtilisin family serine protease
MTQVARNCALAAILLSLIMPSVGQAQPAWAGKVDDWVLERADGIGGVEYIVFLAAQADLSAARLLPSKAEKGQYVFDTLTAQARATQGPILDQLAELGVEHRAYWVANMIWVKSDERVLQTLAERHDVAHVYANPTVALEPPVLIESDGGPSQFGIEASITHTGAPDVFWANGFTGQGIVVGGQDTGYRWDHAALKSQYRGWDGSSADHNYHWHDSIHSGGGVCGSDSAVPCDDNGHGTHTMGTMVGDDGGSNQIGMAPGARWIGCRNMDQGNGTPITYSECFEWFIAPTDLNDQNPDPAMAPHVINNSWSCPTFEGCTDPNVLLTVVENTRAAGILVSVSAGNAGSGCSSVSTPAAIYDASFTIGATDNFDNIASFSSRGPVTVDGSDRLKPDISAPGVSIRSSDDGGGYATLSGTSMASPHVAGMAALVMSAGDCLIGDVDGLEQHMIDAALERTSTQTCGGVPGSEIPNNTYGWGALRSELPTGCGTPVGGAVTSLSTRSASCRNLTNGDSATISLFGALSWDCEAAGLSVSPGDTVLMVIRGKADGGPITGTMSGLTGQTAQCRNADTQQSVSIQLGGGTAWDCSAAGFSAGPNERIQEVVRGTVN